MPTEKKPLISHGGTLGLWARRLISEGKDLQGRRGLRKRSRCCLSRGGSQDELSLGSCREIKVRSNKRARQNRENGGEIPRIQGGKKRSGKGKGAIKKRGMRPPFSTLRTNCRPPILRWEKRSGKSRLKNSLKGSFGSLSNLKP